MNRVQNTNNRGFTLIELLVTMIMAVIVVLGIGTVIADSHRGLNKMYNRVFGSVATDCYMARKAFDAVARQATIKRYDFVSDTELYLYYYSNPQNLTITDPDSYARFYVNNNQLLIDYGTIPAGKWDSFAISDLSKSYTAALADNVTAANFSPLTAGPGVQMVVTLDNGQEFLAAMCSPVIHNDWD